MKKTWTTPRLITHGSVEALTQTNFEEMVKMGQFMIADKASDLLASLEGL